MRKAYCRNCGITGHSRRILRGSFLFEAILWLPTLAFFTFWFLGMMMSTTRDAAAGRQVDNTEMGMAFLMVLGTCALLAIPGLVFSIWRQTTARIGCASCGSAEIVPADSPAARQQLEIRA